MKIKGEGGGFWQKLRIRRKSAIGEKGGVLERSSRVLSRRGFSKRVLARGVDGLENPRGGERKVTPARSGIPRAVTWEKQRPQPWQKTCQTGKRKLKWVMKLKALEKRGEWDKCGRVGQKKKTGCICGKSNEAKEPQCQVFLETFCVSKNGEQEGRGHKNKKGDLKGLRGNAVKPIFKRQTILLEKGKAACLLGDGTLPSLRKKKEGEADRTKKTGRKIRIRSPTESLPRGKEAKKGGDEISFRRGYSTKKRNEKKEENQRRRICCRAKKLGGETAGVKRRMRPWEEKKNANC